MIRVLDATIFNQIAADPCVRPFLGGTGPVDLTNALADPSNFGFLTDEGKGGYIYHRLQAGLYMVHTLALQEGRNRQMLEARSESLRAMFTRTDAVEIVTIVPEGNAGAAIWAKAAGFREVFHRAKAFDLMGEMVDASYQSLAYIDWALRDRSNLHDGRVFHAQIHEVTPDDHGDDPAHDALVGATLECIAQNNAEKGVGLYNRFALHAGYQPIQALTAKPLVLDLRSCIVEVSADGVHVLHVREARSAQPAQDEPGEPECPPQLSAQPQA